MHMIPNAKRIALRSYSLWANYIGIICLIAPEAIYTITGRDTNPQIWWYSGLALIVLSIIGRLVNQGIGDRK